MAYKYTTGSVQHGDIYNEDDAQGNTYLDWSEDALGVVAGGTTNFVVSSSTVGIGTGAPSSSFALDIPVSASTVRMGRLELGAWPTSTDYGFIGHSYQDHHGSGKHLKYNVLISSAGDLSLNSVAGQDMYFRIGAAIKAAIDSNGFFSIGPNAGSTWAPTSLLHLSSSDDSMIFICHDSEQNPVLAVTGSNRVGIGTSSPDSLLHVSSSGDEALLSVDGATNGTVLFVTGSGRVGIGTASPTHEFEVYPDTDVTAEIGRAFVGHNGFNSDAATFGHRDLQGSAYALYQNAAGMTIVNAHSGQDMYFRINNSNKAILDSSGQFGIGTTTPNSTFQVSGSQAGNYTVISGSMTLDETHYIADLTGTINATVTLPAASGVTGRTYHILSTGNGEQQLTITGSGGQFMGSNQDSGPEDSIDIDGGAQSVTLLSTGAYWFILTDNRQQGH